MHTTIDDIRATAAKRLVVPVPKSHFKITKMLTNSSTPGAAPEIRDVAQIGGSSQVLLQSLNCMHFDGCNP